MRITKHVPLGGALTKAADAITPSARDARDDPEHPDYPFLLWMRSTPSGAHPNYQGSNHNTVLDRPWLPTDAVRALLPLVPDTPAGQVWASTAAEALERTDADGYRAYDDVHIDTPLAAAASRALDDLADRLTETVPLLEAVADQIRWQDTYDTTQTFGDLAALRTRITTAGVALDGNDEPEGSSDHRPITKWATWAQIDLLAPGTSTQVLALIADLDGDLPPLATTPDPRRGN